MYNMDINMYYLFITILIYILGCYINSEKNKKYLKNN